MTCQVDGATERGRLSANQGAAARTHGNKAASPMGSPPDRQSTQQAHSPRVLSILWRPRFLSLLASLLQQRALVQLLLLARLRLRDAGRRICLKVECVVATRFWGQQKHLLKRGRLDSRLHMARGWMGAGVLASAPPEPQQQKVGEPMMPSLIEDAAAAFGSELDWGHPQAGIQAPPSIHRTHRLVKAMHGCPTRLPGCFVINGARPGLGRIHRSRSSRACHHQRLNRRLHTLYPLAIYDGCISIEAAVHRLIDRHPDSRNTWLYAVSTHPQERSERGDDERSWLPVCVSVVCGTHPRYVGDPHNCPALLLLV